MHFVHERRPLIPFSLLTFNGRERLLIGRALPFDESGRGIFPRSARFRAKSSKVPGFALRVASLEQRERERGLSSSVGQRMTTNAHNNALSLLFDITHQSISFPCKRPSHRRVRRETRNIITSLLSLSIMDYGDGTSRFFTSRCLYFHHPTRRLRR